MSGHTHEWRIWCADESETAMVCPCGEKEVAG